MIFNIRKKQISSKYICFLLLCLATFLMPRDSLGLKKILFLVTVMSNINIIIYEYKRNVSLFLISVFLPFFLFVISAIQIDEIFLPLTYIYFFAYFPLAFAIAKYDIDIKSIFMVVINIMTFIILTSVLLDISGVMSIYNNPVLQWLNDMGEAQVSASPYAIAKYVIFLKASPVMIYGILVYLERKRYVLASLVFVAVLFTGTRANIYLAILVTVVYVFVYEPNVKLRLVCGLVGIALALRLGTIFYDKVQMINWAKAEGDEIRFAAIESIFNAMNSSKISYLIGMGYGSKYYSLGRIGYIENSELTYLELVREVGIPSAIAFIVFLVNPLFKLYRNHKIEFLFWGAYLVEAVVEPFLFTSTGFCVFMMIFSMIFKEKKEVS